MIRIAGALAHATEHSAATLRPVPRGHGAAWRGGAPCPAAPVTGKPLAGPTLTGDRECAGDARAAHRPGAGRRFATYRRHLSHRDDVPA